MGVSTVRIIFTERDLARVRLADKPHILSEITFSVRALRRRDVSGFEPWRSDTRSRLTPDMRPLLDLVPAHGWIPDFMEPAAGRLPGALDAVCAATAAEVHFDLARIHAERRPPPTAQALAVDQEQALDRWPRRSSPITTWLSTDTGPRSQQPSMPLGRSGLAH
jgi:hypothetical protein